MNIIMNKKINIEELKYLVADYITGDIQESDKIILEKAMAESRELSDFYLQVKGTFSFVNAVKPSEPQPQYWNTLLPRIHQKLEERENRPVIWDTLVSYWKVIVPVAAIILFAVIYLSLKPSDKEIVKESDKQENLTDSNNNKPENVIKNNNDRITEENKSADDNKSTEKNTADDKLNKTVKKDKRNYSIPENYEDKIVKKENRDDIEIPEEKKEKYTDQSFEIDDAFIFAGNESLGLDEEIENDLKKLNDSEKNTLLEDLINVNL